MVHPVNVILPQNLEHYKKISINTICCVLPNLPKFPFYLKSSIKMGRAEKLFNRTKKAFC